MTDKELAKQVVEKLKQQADLANEAKLLQQLADEKLQQARQLKDQIDSLISSVKRGLRGTVFVINGDSYQICYDHAERLYTLVKLDVVTV